MTGSRDVRIERLITKRVAGGYQCDRLRSIGMYEKVEPEGCNIFPDSACSIYCNTGVAWAPPATRARHRHPALKHPRVNIFKNRRGTAPTRLSVAQQGACAPTIHPPPHDAKHHIERATVGLVFFALREFRHASCIIIDVETERAKQAPPYGSISLVCNFNQVVVTRLTACG